MCQPEVLDYIDGDEIMFKRAPLNDLVHDRQLVAYKHHGFWQAMDTLRDKRQLESLWDEGNAKWKIWYFFT